MGSKPDILPTPTDDILGTIAAVTAVVDTATMWLFPEIGVLFVGVLTIRAMPLGPLIVGSSHVYTDKAIATARAGGATRNPKKAKLE